MAPTEDPVVFSPSQVQRIIQRTKPKKAPGQDRISNTTLEYLPQRTFAAVTRLFSGILRTSNFPQEWKIGLGSLLPKPGKNPQKPESYRPITLLRTLSKVFEKLLLHHLFGFHAEHSTTLQLAKVLHEMTVRLIEKESTIAVLRFI